MGVKQKAGIEAGEKTLVVRSVEVLKCKVMRCRWGREGVMKVFEIYFLDLNGER